MTSPRLVAVSTSACTASREDASTVATLTSYPAFPRTSAAALALSGRMSASRTCLPTPTRRAISLTDLTGSDEDEYVCHTSLRTASRSSRTRCGSCSSGMLAVSCTASSEPGGSASSAPNRGSKSCCAAPDGRDQLERLPIRLRRGEAPHQDLRDLASRDDAVARIAGVALVALQQDEAVLGRGVVVEPAGPHDRVGPPARPHEPFGAPLPVVGLGATVVVAGAVGDPDRGHQGDARRSRAERARTLRTPP